MFLIFIFHTLRIMHILSLGVLGGGGGGVAPLFLNSPASTILFLVFSLSYLCVLFAFICFQFLGYFFSFLGC